MFQYQTTENVSIGICSGNLVQYSIMEKILIEILKIIQVNQFSITLTLNSLELLQFYFAGKLIHVDF